MRVEHEYERRGAWAYRAPWDVRRAKIHGRETARPRERAKIRHRTSGLEY